MRLRRLELVIIGVTLAFACFMGGYLAGRSWSAVNIAPMAPQHGESWTAGAVVPVAPSAPSPAEASQGDSAQAPGAGAGTGAGAGSQVDAPVSSRDSEGRININLASRSELMDLPGIGSALSERIVNYRNTNGPFSRIEDLRNVSGIGEKRFEAIKDRITV
jgi:competence ComEA-like helix-hairpin-helix protein